ncbi:MAG TPA: hypothetical protein VNB94_05045 [Mycobacteriales bacterium]|nr:hypothetical protein [Mycobacteriales bacterium]
MPSLTPDHDSAPTEISRRTAIIKGTALTAAVWAAPAITSAAPAFAQGSPPAGQRQSIDLRSSQQATGTDDPLVEVLLNGSWVPATAVNNGFYVAFPGTGFVDARGVCAGNTIFAFRVPFTLPAGFASPQLDGRAQADNDVAVRLNGSPVLAAQPANNSTSNFDGNNPAVFSTDNPAFFVPGQNFLYFDVHNFGCPLALDLIATVTYLG